MFREYKDYDVTTRLDTYDGQKIKNYEIALTPNHPVRWSTQALKPGIS